MDESVGQGFHSITAVDSALTFHNAFTSPVLKTGANCFDVDFLSVLKSTALPATPRSPLEPLRCYKTSDEKNPV